MTFEEFHRKMLGLELLFHLLASGMVRSRISHGGSIDPGSNSGMENLHTHSKNVFDVPSRFIRLARFVFLSHRFPNDDKRLASSRVDVTLAFQPSLWQLFPAKK
jgi:hypothetical protein